jgi:hypothetical protein
MKKSLFAFIFLFATQLFAAELPDGATTRNSVYLSFSAQTAQPEGMSVVPGELLEHTADQVLMGHSDMVVLRKEGHHQTNARFRFALGRPLTPGAYTVWTRFTQGGKESQAFTFRVKSEQNVDAEDRLSFKQTSESWAMEWRKASQAFYLYPEDSGLEVLVEGGATKQKHLAGILLQRTGDLPSKLELAKLKLINAFDKEGEGPTLVILGGDREAQLPLYESLLLDPVLSDTYGLEIPDAIASASMRADLGLSKGAWLISVRANQSIAGMWKAPCSKQLLDGLVGFLKSTDASQELSQFASQQVLKDVKLERMDEGRPAAWLVAGHWSGPAGLSLWGLQAETMVRPNPKDPVILKFFDISYRDVWMTKTLREKSYYDGEPTKGFTWSKGSGYAHVYVYSDTDQALQLHVAHTGIGTYGWCNGQALEFETDRSHLAQVVEVSGPFSQQGVGRTDQGDIAHVERASSDNPKLATLQFKQGWNRVLLKFVQQNQSGELFAFGTQFADKKGRPVHLKTSLSNPEPSLISRSVAARLIPTVHTNAPFNLVYPGDPLSLSVDIGSTNYNIGEYFGRKVGARNFTPGLQPYYPFEGYLELKVYDYDGVELMSRIEPASFPSVVDFNLGAAPTTGYYSTSLTLYDAEKNLVTSYPPDGFSVIKGTAAQAKRKYDKEMAVTYYFMRDEYETLFFPYMQRIGIFRNIGGHNGKSLDMYRTADEQGIILSADLWGHRADYADEYVAETAPYVDSYKGYNEIDIHPETRGTPERWVSIAKGHYEAVQKNDPDALVVGASFARAGADDWFLGCLKFGLAKYHDVWDVHCYPQKPPVLGGTMANSSREAELGVLMSMEKAGMTNDKPFWIGETGARCSHGLDARRWQADTVAKMVACSLSREDFEKIGFLVPWWYLRERGTVGDIEVGHMPGEASYYTASALIDGFKDYQRLDFGEDIQAARFGPTIMLWYTGELASSEVRLNLANEKAWVQVDVVGRVSDVLVDSNGDVLLEVTDSPIYVLSRRNYERLTSF